MMSGSISFRSSPSDSSSLGGASGSGSDSGAFVGFAGVAVDVRPGSAWLQACLVRHVNAYVPLKFQDADGVVG